MICQYQIYICNKYLYFIILFRNLMIIVKIMVKQISDNFLDKFFKINSKLKLEIKIFHFYRPKNPKVFFI